MQALTAWALRFQRIILGVSIALLVVAAALALVHWREGRSATPGMTAKLAVAVLAVVVGTASIVQVVRIGDSGAQSVWGNELTKSDKP